RTHTPIAFPTRRSSDLEHLSAEQTDSLKELSHLQKNIEHIKDIITMQQSFAKVSGLAETVKATDLVEDALRMNASALVRHDMKVDRKSTRLNSSHEWIS